MELTDIMPKEKWIALQEELHQKFALNADIMDKEGKRLSGFTWGNDLCKAIHDDSKGFGAICATAGMMFVQMVKEGEPFVEECDAGMARISLPIKVDGELVGAVGGCGLVVDDGEVDEFTIGMMSELDEETIAKASATVSEASESKVAEIQAFIQEKIDEAIASA